MIGYDAMRQTFLLRDPYERYATEAIAEPFLEKYRATGPHAMVLVPQGRASLLEGLDLLDSALYDKVYQLDRALADYNRDNAVQALVELQNAAPGHPLTLQARRRLAVYDSNHAEILSSLEELLKLFPNEANLRLSKLTLLRDARRDERLNYLQEICGDKHSDPLFWQQYAAELSADARETERATRMLQRSIRYRPMDANSFSIYGDILWAQRRFEQACELYRFAACLEDKREQFAHAFFSSSRHLKQTPAALAWLEDRFNRFAVLSPQPAFTLFSALCQLDQTTRGFEFIKRAVQLRPEDGELLRFAADAHARWGKLDEAEKLLAQARELSAGPSWLRTAAMICDYRSDRKEALTLWRQVLESDPLAQDAQRAIADALGETQGTGAALAHLKAVCERFPYHFPIHQLYLNWLRWEGGQAREQVLRHLIDINPSDAWARRELANLLGDLRRFDEALRESATAAELEPQNPYTYCTRARVLGLAGRAEEAREDYRQAIRLSVDVSYAISGLVELCQSHSERKAALQFVEQELIRQVVFGDGLLAFRDLAHPVLESDELLASLRVALKERPDLWHAYSAVVHQLTEMGRYEEGLLCARDATARFPLLPRLWLDLARVHQARHHHSAEVRALEQALQINPSWSQAGRQLAAAYERDGQLKRASEILQNAVALDPLNAVNHGSLADVLWRLGDRDGAIERARQAILLSPGYDWPWRAIRDWSAQLQKPELAVALARDLTERRAGEPLSWLRLAEMLTGSVDLSERLAALDKAISLNPRCDAAWDLRALTLARANKWDEALSACHPPAWNDPPVMLRARAAWIQRQRGCLPEAIAEMRAVLKENPDNYSCWRELADWLWESGSYVDAREAALKLTRLAPMDAVPLGYLGDIKARLGDRVGAKADFRRALELDPQYTFAGFSLFDLQLEDDDLRGAGETLDILRKQLASEWVRARDAQLALRRGDGRGAMNVLRELCLSPEADAGALHYVADKAMGSGWLGDLEKTVRDVLKDPKAHRYAGTLLVQCHRITKRWWYLNELRRLQKLGKAGEEAVISYISALGETVNQRRVRRELLVPPYFASSLLRLILRRHSSWLRRDDRGWGNVGYALYCFGKSVQTRKWLGDWRERKHAEPWMLNNLVTVLHRSGEDAEAAEVVRHVLAMPLRDSMRPRFQMWAAIEAGLSSNASQLDEWLKGIQKDQLSAYDRELFCLAQTLKEFNSPTPPRFQKKHRQQLGRFLRAHMNDKSMLRAYYRTARLIAERTGSRWAVFWAYGQQYMPVLAGIGIAAVIIAFIRSAK